MQFNEEKGGYFAKQCGNRARSIEEIRERKGELIYCVDVESGMGGAPVLKIDRDGTYSIVGIHIGNVNYTKNNERLSGKVGRMIDPDFIKLLQNEAEKLNAIQFKVKENRSPTKPIEILLHGDSTPL